MQSGITILPPLSIYFLYPLIHHPNIFPSSSTEMSDCGLQVMQTVFANFSKIDYIKSIKDILSSLREVSMCEAPDFKAIRRLKIDLILTTSSLSELTSDEREELNDLLNRIIDELKAFRFNEKQEIISDYLQELDEKYEVYIILSGIGQTRLMSNFINEIITIKKDEIAPLQI